MQNASLLPVIFCISLCPLLSFVWGKKLSLFYKWKRNGGHASGDLQEWLFSSSIHNRPGSYLHFGRKHGRGVGDAQVPSSTFQQSVKIKPLKIHLVCMVTRSHLGTLGSLMRFSCSISIMLLRCCCL